MSSTCRQAACVAVALLLTPVQAADRRSGPSAVGDPFAPARPAAVASELPRSPLADVIVFGSERFDRLNEARGHCPSDVVVRVELLSSVYDRAPRTATERSGTYMCRSSALSEGDHLP